MSTMDLNCQAAALHQQQMHDRSDRDRLIGCVKRVRKERRQA